MFGAIYFGQYFPQQAAAGPSGPALSSVSPSVATPGQTISITLNGSGFSTGYQSGPPLVAVSGLGITPQSVTVNNDSKITVSFVIASNAALTSRSVTVITDAGTSGSVSFTLTSATATVQPEGSRPGGMVLDRVRPLARDTRQEEEELELLGVL